MGSPVNINPKSRLAVKKNPRKRSSDKSRLMALSAANKIAEISSAVLTPGAKDRGYVVSEVSARVNRGDLTGALSVAYQAAKAANVSGNYSTFTLDEAAKDIVFKVSQGWSSPATAEKIRGLLYKRNPAITIRSLAKRSSPYDRDSWRRAKVRRAARFTVSHAGRPTADASQNYFHVQVRRGKRWLTLATFPRGDIAKARAKEYGNLYAARFPRMTFRLFWPDDSVKKNPAPRGGKLEAPQAEIDAASKLREQFSGHKTTTARNVRIPGAKVALAIGQLLAVAYETTRDGKREKYLHEFRRGARPTLAASSDGRSLFMLGGAYRFTDRGIVDQ